jgi:DNA-binding GntR family transcriptional regulator
MLGVSRTPLREAMRRLEAEGLIEAEQNQRARVASADAEALDVRFTDWILLQAMGVKVTVPLLSELELNTIVASTTSFRVAAERADVATLDRARRSLHAAFVARAGYRLRSAIEDQFEACERAAIVGCSRGVRRDRRRLHRPRRRKRLAPHRPPRRHPRPYDPDRYRPHLHPGRGARGASDDRPRPRCGRTVDVSLRYYVPLGLSGASSGCR